MCSEMSLIGGPRSSSSPPPTPRSNSGRPLSAGVLYVLLCLGCYRYAVLIHDVNGFSLQATLEENDAVVGWIRDNAAVNASSAFETSASAVESIRDPPFLSNYPVGNATAARGGPIIATSTAASTQFDDNQNKKCNSSNDNTTSSKLWNKPEMNSVLPIWIRQYFDWHVEQRNQESQNKTVINYLVVQCLDTFHACGGLSDRLRPMAYYVLMAHRMKRVLLIRWTRPCALEEFLIPPKGGIDWKVPSFLVHDIPTTRGLSSSTKALTAEKSTARIMTAAVQLWDAGKEHWEQYSAEGKFHDISAVIFQCFFTLAEPLAKRVEATRSRLGLKRGEYTGAHVRARYPSRQIRGQTKTADKDGNHQFLDAFIDIGTNAIHCAFYLQPNKPVYFASDSHHLVHFMLYNSSFTTNARGVSSNNTASLSRKVTAIEHTQEPLHIDTNYFRDKKPEDFYPLFVDLFLLGEAKCMAFGMGTYGRFAQLFNSNMTCYINHRNFKGRVMRCPAP